MLIDMKTTNLTPYIRSKSAALSPTSRRRQTGRGRTASPHLYRNRKAIERMFCRLEDFRRIAPDTIDWLQTS
jgi:transposase